MRIVVSTHYTVLWAFLLDQGFTIKAIFSFPKHTKQSGENKHMLEMLDHLWLQQMRQVGL